MAFCTKCGNQVADGTAFCPSCGQSMAAAPAPAASTARWSFQQEAHGE